MRYRCFWFVTLGLLSAVGHGLPVAAQDAVLQSQQVRFAQACRPGALSRMTRHRVASGETLQSIANRYNLLPATLMGFNPALRSGTAPVGAQLLIPPFNGIRVDVPAGKTLRDIAKTYKVRPDVLFEVNGCQPNPRVVFVPGVNWSPTGTAAQPLPDEASQLLSMSPIATAFSESTVLLGYGYKVQPGTTKVAFHSGIDLAAPVGSSVVSVGNGTVAFAGRQGAYGNLVVINHPEGLQTRYAQLGRIQVKVGQTIRRGQPIATVGTSGTPSSKQPHLHFEVRSRSNLGWVAQDPTTVLKNAKN